MKELASYLLLMLVMFFCILGIVGVLTKLGVDTAPNPPTWEVQFRTACAAVGGKVVFNGKNLECLK